MSPVNKRQLQAKIDFLEAQLMELNHYLPEAYDYLLRELDHHKRIAAELEVANAFDGIDLGQQT